MPLLLSQWAWTLHESITHVEKLYLHRPPLAPTHPQPTEPAATSGSHLAALFRSSLQTMLVHSLLRITRRTLSKGAPTQHGGEGMGWGRGSFKEDDECAIGILSCSDPAGRSTILLCRRYETLFADTNAPSTATSSPCCLEAVAIFPRSVNQQLSTDAPMSHK